MNAFKIFTIAATLISTTAFAKDDLRGAPEPKLHYQRGENAAKPISHQRNSSPLLTYRGGSVLSSSNTYVVFWGSSWNDANFAGDKVSGVDRFFTGFGNSSYARTSNEYSGGGKQITSNSSYFGHVVDTSAAPSRAPSVSTIVSEACRAASNQPDPNGVYFIYTSTKAGQVNYCAWHSWGNCSNGVPIQVAYIPNLDGIAGCDPQDNSSGNSQGLSAIANVTAHELLEAITDPRGSGWLDNSGAENGDKCAWSFPPADGLSTFSDGSRWKLQMEWSNAAYTAGTGLSNLNGQNACIY